MTVSLQSWLNEMSRDNLNTPSNAYSNGSNNYKNMMENFNNYIREKQKINQADSVSFEQFFKTFEWFKCSDSENEKKAMIDLFVYYIGAKKVMELTIDSNIENKCKYMILDNMKIIDLEEIIGYAMKTSNGRKNKKLEELKKYYLGKVNFEEEKTREEFMIENKLLKKELEKFKKLYEKIRD